MLWARSLRHGWAWPARSVGCSQGLEAAWRSRRTVHSCYLSGRNMGPTLTSATCRFFGGPATLTGGEGLGCAMAAHHGEWR